MKVDVDVTDINGLKALINKIGYENILNILIENGLYTVIYNVSIDDFASKIKEKAAFQIKNSYAIEQLKHIIDELLVGIKDE